jgi:hypothetical protein
MATVDRGVVGGEREHHLIAARTTRPVSLPFTSVGSVFVPGRSNGGWSKQQRGNDRVPETE